MGHRICGPAQSAVHLATELYSILARHVSFTERQTHPPTHPPFASSATAVTELLAISSKAPSTHSLVCCDATLLIGCRWTDIANSCVCC